ncbi:hypothetical protein [Sphingomonas adhaesiva]|uniref:hypothetical protein n=1 Tax=Sphingomonas adhaesiva TaxID=28212 RepID=UPI002FF565E1
MSVDTTLLRIVSVDNRVADIEATVANLRTGGGGGTSGGMEPRIAKLEAQMEAVRSDLGKLGSLPVDVARLDERVKHLPSKGFVVTATTTSIGLIGAMVLFADKLRAFVGG